MKVGKEKTNGQLAALGNRIEKAATAEEFANAVIALLSLRKGSVLWVEARAIWPLVDSGELTRMRALQVIGERFAKQVNFGSASMKQARNQLKNLMRKKT
jgi:EAL domain-containing protein (putative c-di-GMP-specific phosphodiesterase class I)